MNVSKLGFGLMRLPLLNEEDQESVDVKTLEKMVDSYMDAGFNYFDTAYPYHFGKSEISIKETLVNRYPREDFFLADKMPLFFLEKEEQLEEFFNEQLERCGVDYFDYYLLHNVSTWTKNAFENIDSFKFIEDKKAEGKIKHIGFSFHDNAELLEEVLTKHPEVEFVQLQINFLDWNNESIQAKECYEVARKHNVDIIVMEPLKGGTLVNMPEDAKNLLNDYDSTKSIASWGIRYAASLEGVLNVLVGMSNFEQTEENIKIMKDFKVLTDEEHAILDKTVKIINDSIAIPCTKCNYCLKECPMNVPIPTFFELYNDEEKMGHEGFSAQQVYYNTYSLNDKYGSASDCTGCEECVKNCPQHLDIPKHLEDIAQLFEVDLAQ